VKELHTIDVRVEAQNLLNPNFAVPNLTVGTSTLGYITATVSGEAGNARVMQFRCKYSFCVKAGCRPLRPFIDSADKEE
jgi:hypothetical protein